MSRLDKVLIIGSPGSGKSYYSKKISEKTGLPLIHIDNLYWNKDKTHITLEELEVKIEEVVNKEQWIIDGNFKNTFEQRLKKADIVLYLDFSTEQCIKGVEGRIGTENDDVPWVEEEFDPDFREYILGFRENIRPQMIEILDKYEEKEKYFFNNREEIDEFIASL